MSELEVDEAPPLMGPASKEGSMYAEEGTHVPYSQQNPEASWRLAADAIIGVRVGVLLGITDDGRTPLVVFPGQPGSAAVAARATIDLHGDHIGREVVLMFEDGDPGQPIVMGCLAHKDGWPIPGETGSVEVDVDGERLVVSAKEQLVLRCGKAAITLTKAGKVLIQGTYVSSRSTGANRIRGGSVNIN